MTIVIVGIVSATALPKLFNFSTYQQRTFFDDTLNAIRYAQKLAVATACNVQVAIAGNQFTLTRPAADRSRCTSTSASDFTQAVTRPGSGESSYQGSQSGVALTATTVYFTAKGNASSSLFSNGVLAVNVGSRQITIVQDTGFVYDSSP